MTASFEFIPFGSVGELSFGNIGALPQSVMGCERCPVPGGDRFSYGDAGVVVMYYADDLVEFIGVYPPNRVTIKGNDVLNVRYSSFLSLMDRLGIVGGKEFGFWLSSDRSFSVGVDSGRTSVFTAYSREYLTRGTGFNWRPG